MSSGISFSGLSSGVDTATIIEQLIAIERRPVVLLENQQLEEELKLQVLQQINTSLLTVKNSAEALSSASDFDVFDISSSDSDIVDATVSGTPATGSFTVEVLALAQAQTRSSGSFASNTDALGFSGDIVLNGQAVTVSSSDSLEDIQETISNADAGVQAQILQVSDTDFRLLLSSDSVGADGFSLLDASTSDVLQSLGFTATATSIKNSVSGGAQTDKFASSTTAAGSLLGLGDALSGNVTIGDQNVAIDLSTQSLSDIKDAIDAAAPTGVTTSIVSEEVDGETVFQLQIDGTTTFVDDSNVLEALGILQGASAITPAVAEVHTSNLANTTNGSTPVDSNAKFNEIFGASVANGDTISISGTDHDGTAVSGSFTITNTNSDRISDLLTEIESVFGSITAGINSSGQLEIADDSAGDSQLSFTVQANNEGGGSLSFGTLAASTQGEDSRSLEVVAGQDATFRVNGVTLTRSSNSISDAIEGISLDLNSAEPGTTVSISTSQDTTTIKSNIETMVATFNNAITLINAQFVFNEDSQSSGPFSGDSTLLTLQSQLRSVLTDQVQGLNTDEDNLTLFGVTFNRTGELEIDDEVLNDALANNLDAVTGIFSTRGTTSDSDIEFVFQTDDTAAGSYDVDITTAGEQATILGSTDLSSGLAAAETITITDLSTNKTESIDLDAGDDIDTIVTKINSSLSSSAAEVRTGSLANTDSATPIDSTTTFDSIDGAGVVADDTIDIQGTLHNGTNVSGSFTISDPTTQTVGDLLDEIRSVFQSSVSASIDSSGQIVITDNEVGNSSLTTVLIERKEGGGDLNFGSIDVTTEGRFAIGITASNESDQLRLTADSYGSTPGFTVSQSNGGVDTGVTDGTYNGVDVEGTINGETATGTGQILVGDSDSDSISGLSIRAVITAAELTTQGPDQGTVNITQGVADLLRRSLESITDPVVGLVATKEDAIQDTIDSAEDQIQATEGRLALTESTLLRQFTAMEIAVAELNSVGAFLGSQLASLSGRG
jgi:flagellar hook-associated protein 2